MTRLFAEGTLVLKGETADSTGEDVQAADVLADAFARYRQTVAAPLLAWAPHVGLAAARFLQRAGWLLFDRAVAPDELRKVMTFAHQPRSASEHLSVDLTFRYLPGLLRRAQAAGTGDMLVGILTEVLRRWPLSGVLAAIPEPPLADLNFAGHAGLQLLYAERLAEHFNPGWLPAANERAYLELVWSELGKDPALLANTDSAAADEEHT